MAMIFPGMDPYLEDPQFWPGVHSAMVVYIRDQLQPLLRPRYIAAVEERVFVEGPNRDVVPDVWIAQTDSRETLPAVAVAESDQPVLVEIPELEIHESFVQILDKNYNQQVVAVIEVVSPTNKFSGPGRDSYLSKQREVRAITTHLVEIDMLRVGQHVLSAAEWAARGRGNYDYLVCVNRAAGLRDRFELYPSQLRERLPRIRVPLAGDDPDVVLNIQSAVEQVYDAGSYRDRINYAAPCVPPLSDENQAWANEILKNAAAKE